MFALSKLKLFRPGPPEPAGHEAAPAQSPSKSDLKAAKKLLAEELGTLNPKNGPKYAEELIGCVNTDVLDFDHASVTLPRLLKLLSPQGWAALNLLAEGRITEVRLGNVPMNGPEEGTNIVAGLAQLPALAHVRICPKPGDEIDLSLLAPSQPDRLTIHVEPSSYGGRLATILVNHNTLVTGSARIPVNVVKVNDDGSRRTPLPLGSPPPFANAVSSGSPVRTPPDAPPPAYADLPPPPYVEAEGKF
jgi:hypothetical protein